MEAVDLLVVGGGINGAGIARDAAGRGLSVVLVEKDDLAAHTSSASSKLIHGGLRYLEQFEFKLVRESLAERELLLRAAPHIVRPLQFLLPLTSSTRPAWMIRAGLFLYDHLGSRRLLPGSRSVELDGYRLVPEIRRGFSYWDCQVQDSRLVVLNAMDAAERGATILTRTELVHARREEGLWVARIRAPGHERSVRARALVNAAGPWVAQLFAAIEGVSARRRVRLVKGSHIVVPRLYEGEHAFILQNPDRRVVFAIPFEREFTLVGTTDVEWSVPPGTPIIADDEIAYLRATIRRYFGEGAAERDVVWSYSGIRALVDDGASDPSEITRDYVLDLDALSGSVPLLSVFGGKITTYRRLSEQAVDRLKHVFPGTHAWTKDAILPGGDISEGYAQELARKFAALPAELLARLTETYGTRTERLLAGERTADDLGEHFGAGLYAKEVDYLVSQEWARTAEDILYRRTKLGLRIPPDAVKRLSAYLGRVSPGSPVRRRPRRRVPE